jgi:sulfonate transport system substrate-binding protein
MVKWRAGIAALLGLGLMAGAAPAQDKIPLRVAAATGTEHIAVFIGVEKGFFAAHGLDVKVDIYPTGVEIVNSLVGGQDDVAVLGTPPFLSGASKGMPLMMIGHLHGDALAASYSGGNSIVASEKSGLAEGDIAGLKGKKVGLPRGTGAETHLRGVLQPLGISLDDLTLINLAPGDIPTALRNGDVDAISAWEPWASTTLLKVPGARRIVWGGCGSCYDPGSILTTPGQIAKDPEALRRFVLAFAQSQQWMRQNMDDAAEIGTRWIPGVELDVLKAAVRNSGYDMRLSQNSVTGYGTVSIPALVADGRIESFDIRKFIDPQFYNFAAETAPEYFSDLPALPAELALQ